MKSDVKVWLDYAEENFKAAQILNEQMLYNPCLQNIQQCVEKGLKALLLQKAHSHRKTHSITELVQVLVNSGIEIDISDEDCDLLDSIYLPSKYPLGGALPDFEPDVDLCNHCLTLAEKALFEIMKELLDE